jgi:hypothetical protein
VTIPNELHSLSRAAANNPMCDPEPAPNPALQKARISFRAYYASGTEADALWLDTLVLAWTAFVENIAIPRHVLPDALRDHVERTGNAVETNFMQARDKVRASMAYRSLLPSERKQIADVLFNPFLPWE